MANVRTQTPTADLLVNQMRTGSLDAVVVYEANTTKVRDDCELVRIGTPAPMAVQTFSVGKGTKYKQLVGRLFERFAPSTSRARYEAAGFHWMTNADDRVSGETQHGKSIPCNGSCLPPRDL